MQDIIISSPGRILLSVGDFDLYTYGLIMAIAILCGVAVSNYLANSMSKFPKDIFISLAPSVIITGFLGARLWYCILNIKYFLLLPMNILNFRDAH